MVRISPSLNVEIRSSLGRIQNEVMKERKPLLFPPLCIESRIASFVQEESTNLSPRVANTTCCLKEPSEKYDKRTMQIALYSQLFYSVLFSSEKQSENPSSWPTKT